MPTQGQQAVETILKLTVKYEDGIKAVGSLKVTKTYARALQGR